MQTPFILSTEGRWSGGGANVLRNLRDICEHRPDVLTDERSISGWVFTARNAAPPRLLRSRKFVLMPQNAWPWSAPGYRNGRLPTWAALRLASEASLRRAKAVVRIGSVIPRAPSGRDTRIPNVLDLAFEGSLQQAGQITVPEWVSSCFVTVGSVGPYRNLDRLIVAYRDYRLRGGSRELLVIGEPTSHAQTQRLLDHGRRTPGLRLSLRNKDRATILAVMRSSAGVVLPSWIEASPYTPLEAAAVGARLACSQITGNQETLSAAGVTPIYFEPFSVPSISFALQELEAESLCVPWPIESPVERERLRVAWRGAMVAFLEALQRGLPNEA